MKTKGKIKWFVLCALLVMTAALLAGCQGGGGGVKGNITFYYWDENQTPGMDKVVEIATKDNPNVKIESTVIPWAQYWTKLQTSLPSDNGPDVFWSNFSHAVDYIQAGLLQEVQTYIDRDSIDMSPFPSAMKEMYSSDGKMYAIPKDYDTIALFYNKAMFDAKGVAYPTDDWTVDDLLTAAQALTDESTYGFITQAATQVCLYPFMLSNEGTVMTPDRKQFTLNNPGTIEATQFMVDMMYKYNVSPSAASMAELAAEDQFYGEKGAMITMGSWSVPPATDALGDKLGIARFPIFKKEANVIHGLGICISNASKNKDAAWLLAKAFTTKEGGEAQAGVVIPAYAGADAVWKANFPNLNLDVFTDAAQYADIIFRATVNSANQGDVVESSLQNIWLQDETVEAAFARVDAECAALAAG